MKITIATNTLSVDEIARTLADAENHSVCADIEWTLDGVIKVVCVASIISWSLPGLCGCIERFLVDGKSSEETSEFDGEWTFTISRSKESGVIDVSLTSAQWKALCRVTRQDISTLCHSVDYAFSELQQSHPLLSRAVWFQSDRSACMQSTARSLAALGPSKV
jgi:hypothetical protein